MTSRRIAWLAAASIAAAVPPLAAAPATAATARSAPSAAPPGATSAFVAIAPVRLADTRGDSCGCTPVGPTTIRVDVTGHVDVPDDAIAAAVTITSPASTEGFVTAYPAGTPLPDTSTLNTRADRDVANSAIIPLGDGAIDVFTSAPGQVIVDVTGVFVPAEAAAAGRLLPLAPQRLLDTRAGGTAAPSDPQTVVDVPIPAELADAAALAINVTHVGNGRPGFVSIGGPTTSFLNYPASSTAVAATTIAPLQDGRLRLYDDGGGFLIVDLFGWFTGPGATASPEGLFVPIAPQRMLDTRAVEGRLHAGGSMEAPSPVTGAAALATNVTATLADRGGYLTVYPAGTPLPDTSSLNPSHFDHTLANLALTPVSTRGVAVHASAGTDVLIDVTGFFTGAPQAATLPPASNDYQPPRVLVIGDSGLRGVVVNGASLRAFASMDVTVDAAGCRRLHEVSCTSPGINTPPPTALQAIAAAPGRFDIVVITAGHNDSLEFPLAFRRVVDAARAKGAHTILWQNYSMLSKFPWLDRNSFLLNDLAGRPGYEDVVVADWRRYTAGTGAAWLWDGIHMTAAGAWAQTDFLARWIAAIEHRPCPAPRTPGGPIDDPCPIPETVGAPANPAALYG